MARVVGASIVIVSSNPIWIVTSGDEKVSVNKDEAYQIL
jgi:hypothetical protein